MLPAGGGGVAVAVHVINKMPSIFTIDAGREVGQANVAGDISCSAVAQYNQGQPVQERVQELVQEPVQESVRELAQEPIQEQISLYQQWEEYAHLLPDVECTHLLPVIDSLPEELTDDERRGAVEFLKQYSQVFSRSEYDLRRTSFIIHRIDTGDAKPFRQGLRRHPQAYLDVIDTEIVKMEAAGVIEAASSPWASNVVVVAKHDNTPRITLDYR